MNPGLMGRGLAAVAVASAVLLIVSAVTAQQAAPMTVQGFQTPESVLYDGTADLYLVSNINGNPTGVDGNGFISQVAPDGKVVALKWIDGTKAGVTLNAPKGTAVVGDTLYAADITAVRMFDRRTGAFKGSINVPGSTFLNDVAAGPDGSVYVTDSGLKPDFSPSGTDTIYKIDRFRMLTTVVKGTQLKGPNGVAVLPDGRLVVVTFSQGGEWYKVTTAGQIQEPRTLPAGQLDGVVVLSGGALLVSSWASSSVYRVGADGRATVAVANVKAPADIGYDTKRNAVLIPMFQDNRVVIQPVR